MAHRRKRSVSLDPVLDDQVEAAATAASLAVSARLSRWIAGRLITEDGLCAMREYEELFGPLSPDELDAADAVIDGSVVSASSAYAGQQRSKPHVAA